MSGPRGSLNMLPVYVRLTGVSTQERPRRLSFPLQELVDLLLAPLSRRFPLCEIFFEERRRSTLALRPAPSSMSHVTRGLQLRGVGAKTSALSYTTDRTPAGLRRALSRQGLSAPRVLPLRRFPGLGPP